MASQTGWIVYNGNLGTGKFLDHATWFDRTARHYGLHTMVVKNNGVLMVVEDGKTGLKGEFSQDLPEFALFWDKDIRLAEHLERLGVRLFNRARAIDVCDNKSMTYQALADKGVRMPKTVIGPKVFNWLGVIEFEIYDQIAAELGFPMVIKEAYGSFGSQVYLVQNKDEMIRKVTEIRNSPCLFQEFVASSYGRDLRIEVVGGRVVAAMKRVSEDDFRANISNGGKAYPHTPSAAEAELAVRSAQLLGLDFAGVDLLFGPSGEPILCEVNSNAHIKNLYECTGVDAADAIIRHVIAEMGYEQ